MSNNQPDFDPLNASKEEEQEMLRGYLAAGNNLAKPEITSIAFEHGWRMRRNDLAKVIDDDQRVLARRLRVRNGA